MRRVNDDEGTVLVLAVGGVLLVLATVLVLADVSSMLTRRTALLELADTAAIAASNGIDVDAIYAGGVGDTLVLDAAEAERLARQAVDGADEPRLSDIRVDSVRVQEQSVWVVLSAAVPAPLSGITGTRDVRIRAGAGASARTRF